MSLVEVSWSHVKDLLFQLHNNDTKEDSFGHHPFHKLLGTMGEPWKLLKTQLEDDIDNQLTKLISWWIGAYYNEVMVKAGARGEAKKLSKDSP
jgi:hypothetical protein